MTVCYHFEVYPYLVSDRGLFAGGPAAAGYWFPGRPHTELWSRPLARISEAVSPLRWPGRWLWELFRRIYGTGFSERARNKPHNAGKNGGSEDSDDTTKPDVPLSGEKLKDNYSNSAGYSAWQYGIIHRFNSFEVLRLTDFLPAEADGDRFTLHYTSGAQVI